MIIYYLSVALAAYAASTVIYRLFFSPLRKIPGPLIARLTSISYYLMMGTGSTSSRGRSDYHQYGDIYVMAPNMVSICHPDDCRRIMSSYEFRKAHLYDALGVTGESIISTKSPELNKMRRRQFGPMFTPGYLAEMEPIIMEYGVKALKRKWEAEGLPRSVNYAEDFLLVAIDVISTLCYGEKVAELDNRQFLEWRSILTNLAVFYVAVPWGKYFPFTLLTRRGLAAKHEICQFAEAVAERRRQSNMEGKEKPKDILQALIDAEDPMSKSRMTSLQIIAESTTMLMVGSDTTALAMAWTMSYLMLYPECYRKAVKEVRAKFAPDHLITSAECRAQLPYVEACIYESLRIRAPSSIQLPRVVPKGGAVFQGHFLPEGTIVSVNVAALGCHRSLWADPERFDPERFLNNSEAKNNLAAFNTGQFKCPGRNLSWMEMTTIFANLLKDFDFALPDDAIYRPTVVSNDGLPVPIPLTSVLSVVPKFPDRDCNVIVTKANARQFKWYGTTHSQIFTIQ